MQTKRLFGRLAAACLFLTVSFSAAQAQVRRPTTYSTQGRRPVYTAPQTAASNGVQLGIRAGVNVADWYGDAVQSVMSLADYTNGAVTRETRTGFHAGLYATLPLGERFAIEPGVLYSEKGTQLRGTASVPGFEVLSANVTATARTAYVDVPVLAKAYLTRGLYLYAGPQASFLVSSKVRVAAGALGFTAFRQDFDTKNQFRSVDFAAVGGLGYQFDSGFGLSAGYDYGLSSLDKNNSFQAQNRVIKASLNYSF
ncbi:PorT family protein [Hymenobacter sp. NBH84]|uniref:porin family protein n=1 Tax=Hymenobacter sp. NBH84 TaxID=2596915 RepID=UPI0016299FE9|nr:porin family protein [Hymenobacter sp. NBH84]QNE40994.1 PorT family protein [Hymenobacter sp. NBH84]